MGLISTALRLVAGRPAGQRRAREDEGTAGSDYDPDLECFLLQMSVLSQLRLNQRAHELAALGFERRQQTYESTERELDFILRSHSVAQDLRESWLPRLMYTLRCEVERQDLTQLMKRATTPLPPPLLTQHSVTPVQPRA